MKNRSIGKEEVKKFKIGYIEKNPNCTNDEIYDFLKKRAIQKGKKITKYGWIPDPLDDYLIN